MNEWKLDYVCLGEIFLTRRDTIFTLCAHNLCTKMRCAERREKSLFILRALQQFGGMSVRRHIFSALFHLARRVNGTFKVNTLMTKFQYRTQISLFKERNSIRAAAANIYNIKMQTVNSTFFYSHLISPFKCVCVVRVCDEYDLNSWFGGEKIKNGSSLSRRRRRRAWFIPNKGIGVVHRGRPGGSRRLRSRDPCGSIKSRPVYLFQVAFHIFFVHPQISIIFNCMQWEEKIRLGSW